jgi:hypothetical protein
MFTRYRAVFLKVWSVDHWWSTAVRQVVRGDLQIVSEEKALHKLYHILN